MILNLVYPELSEIKYEVRKYPDGQQDVIIPSGLHEKFFLDSTEITIKSRLNSFKDLELILCAT